MIKRFQTIDKKVESEKSKPSKETGMIFENRSDYGPFNFLFSFSSCIYILL